MLIRIPEVLSKQAVAQARSLLERADWVDGRVTAGVQSAKVKNNLQLPEDSEATRSLRPVVMQALARNALFFTAALPQRVIPPLFNCYTGSSNTFGDHVDNALRPIAGSDARVRTDLSATLFLSEPEEYDGGELVVQDTFGTQRIKLAAGEVLLYPSSSVHRVEAVTRGARYASFFWVQSLVRSNEQRRLLFDMDMAILELRQRDAESPAAVKLTGCYHNLLRMWSEP
jgi:PKHD-type hydroxylase